MCVINWFWRFFFYYLFEVVVFISNGLKQIGIIGLGRYRGKN